MFKLALVVIAAAYFTTPAQAQASVLFDPHYLVGSVHITNPAGSFKADHTEQYNTLHNTSALCEIAKAAAETVAVTIYPAANTANFGKFYKVSTLQCVSK